MDFCGALGRKILTAVVVIKVVCLRKSIDLVIYQEWGECSVMTNNKVRGASFDSNKYDLIEVASLGGYYTCGQCAKMMRLFTFDDDRLKVFGFMAPHVVEPENAIDVYRLLDFESSKEKGQRMMRGR